jgi:hypothetical protein
MVNGLKVGGTYVGGGRIGRSNTAGSGEIRGAGDGGTGLVSIRYRKLERGSISSIDSCRNISSPLTSYRIGNYGDDFKILKNGTGTPILFCSYSDKVCIGGSLSATQVFQVGDRGGRL